MAAIRLRVRTVASSWLTTSTIFVALSSASSAAVSERGTSSTVYRLVWLAKSSSVRIRAASKLRGDRPPGRAQQVEPDLVRTTSPLKNAASSRCTFSSASTTEKRGSAPRKTAASPQATFRSISSVESGSALASAVATFTATVVAPTPPFAPMNAKMSPLRGRREIAHQPLDRGLQLGDGERVGHELVHAGAHRFEHQRRIELRRDEQHAGGRMIAACSAASAGGIACLSAQIDDQHVGLRRARLREGRERLARDDRARHARLANELHELGVGGNQLDDGRHRMLR